MAVLSMQNQNVPPYYAVAEATRNEIQGFRPALNLIHGHLTTTPYFPRCNFYKYQFDCDR